MKKLLSLFLVAVMGFQMMAQMGPLPVDAKTRKGTLPNGLTYYIRANAEPKGQAEFFIAQKVGSIQEEENQRGLAHFLEHMAFNGLRHFPGKNLFTFTEGIGVRFGYNLNAGTGFDMTVYNISAVPIEREGIIDSCLMVLWDWADGLLLLPDEIDSERGVIREEMRTRDIAIMRIYEKIGKEVMPGNKYAERWPIGTEDVVMNFKPQEIRDYYEKWYRPDHQAIIVVGDFDADKMEEKIKTMFSNIAAPTTPSELAPVVLEPNEKPIVAIATDPEMTMTAISIDFKHEALPAEIKLSAQGLLLSYVQSMVTSMLNSRYSEIAQKSNPPFIQAHSTYSSFFITQSADAFSVEAVSKEGDMTKAFTAAITELARVKQHGFTASEYERAKANYLSHMERSYKERDKRKSESYAQEFVRNFTEDEPIPGIETEYTLANQFAELLTVDQINQIVQQFIHDENLVIYGWGPQKEGLVYPTEEEILTIYAQTFSTEQAPYEDKVSDQPLIANMPKAGTVKKTKANKTFGTKEFTLSNGIRVVIKPTDFKDDEIRFTGTSFGGSSLFAEKDVPNAKMIDAIATIGGIGEFSKVELNKALAGKQASVRSSISLTSEDLFGNCSPKDLETMMQLIYLYATAPRYDQEAFESYIERMKAMLENQANEPMKAFSDSLTYGMFGDNPRAKSMSLEDMSKIDYKRVIELYKERFADMNDFTFVFVGNIDEKTFIPLMEQYIGALPTGKRKEIYQDVRMYTRTGERDIHFNREMQTIKTSVAAVYTGKMDYTPANILKLEMLSQVMDIVYTTEIREKEGGTYGVAVQTDLDRYPYGCYVMLIYFDTDPQKVNNLVPIMYRELNKMAEEGPSQENFDKVKSFMIKDAQEKTRDNGAWLSALKEFYMYNTDGFTKKEDLIKGITADDIKNIAKQILNDKNHLELIMTGVEKK